MKKLYLPMEVKVRFLDANNDIVTTSIPLDDNEGDLIGGEGWWDNLWSGT